MANPFLMICPEISVFLTKILRYMKNIFLVTILSLAFLTAKGQYSDEETAIGKPEYTKINTSNFAFPNGKLKCLIMSFDDGPEHDRILIEKLNDANITGTFHLNSGRLGQKAEWLSSELGYEVFFIDESEVSTLYQGHEVSGHSAHHTGFNNQSDSTIRAEVLSDFGKLNALLSNTDHDSVQGLAYAFGAYDKQTLKTLNELGVKYARTTASTQNFEIPATSFLTFHPTCHIFNALKYGYYFVKEDTLKMQLLNVWGHSYEFHDNWKLADSICNLLGNNEDVWYAKTIEFVDYVNAIRKLSYVNDSVYNPSEEIALWIKNKHGEMVKLEPGQSMAVDFNSSFITEDETAHLYPSETTMIPYHGDWTRNHYKERIAEFKESPLNFGEVVFIGNSITEQGGDWSIRLGIEGVRNRGIAGDVTDGVLMRMDEIIHYKPETVFLLIGINDLFNLYYQKEIPSPEYVADNIIKITELIHKELPETKICLQTILPTREEYMTESIHKVNEIISKHEKDSYYQLIDLFKVFVDDDGLLKRNLTTDGIHLNESGYEVWVKAIIPIINKY